MFQFFWRLSDKLYRSPFVQELYLLFSLITDLKIYILHVNYGDNTFRVFTTKNCKIRIQLYYLIYKLDKDLSTSNLLKHIHLISDY